MAKGKKMATPAVLMKKGAAGSKPGKAGAMPAPVPMKKGGKKTKK